MGEQHVNLHQAKRNQESLSRSYLCLALNPLEVDDDDLYLLKTNQLLDCDPHGEASQIAPPYTYMGEAPLRHIFTWS